MGSGEIMKTPIIDSKTSSLTSSLDNGEVHSPVRYRCRQRACSQHSTVSSRRGSCSGKSHNGEEHWTKVLQANEVNSNFLPMSPSEKRKYRKHHRHKHSGCERCRKRYARSRSHMDNESKDDNIFEKLYNRFRQWVNSSKKQSENSDTKPVGRRTRRHRSCDRKSSCSTCHSYDVTPRKGRVEILDPDWSMFYGLTAEELRRTCRPSMSDESDFDMCISSTCSSLTSTLTSTVPSEGHFSHFNSADNVFSHGDTCTHPAESKRVSTTTLWALNTTVPDKPNPVLVSTWPPTNLSRNKVTHIEQPSSLVTSYADLDDVDDIAPFDDVDTAQIDTSPRDVRETLRECSIPFSDLEFGECLRVGRNSSISRGRWHGDVLIHLYRDLSEEEETSYWEEVVQMSMIRHENVVLFMGACIEPPHLAVVTSVWRGFSLYEQIHQRGVKMSMSTKVNIVRQVAQGMGYVHAKGLIIKKLNSRNILLEPKVKLCLIDQGMAEEKYDRPDYGCIARGLLTYVAPEILKTLRVVGPHFSTDNKCTQESDIYAFGTVVYELLSGSFPMWGTPTQPLIYQVVKGTRQSLTNLKCNTSLKALVDKCWSGNPSERPNSSTINKDLQHNAALHKRHSSSEPDKLNLAGLSRKGMFPL